MFVLYFRCLILLLVFSPGFYYSQFTGKVIAIKDGDTIVVLSEDKAQKTLRLAEVDCPESGQPFGKNAKQFTSDLIYGKYVDYFIIDTDRYGRSVAMVFDKNGKYISAEIISAGLGWWYEQYSKDLRLKSLQTEAIKYKRGLWSDSAAVAPWTFRKSYH